MNCPDDQLGSFLSEITQSLSNFTLEPELQRALSDPTWRPADLEDGASIYLRVRESQLDYYAPLVNMVVSQILRMLTDRPEYNDKPVLVLLDEFPRLGRVNKITEALATLRSRNVHIGLMIQSVMQLDLRYGTEERKIISDNCKYKLVLSAGDPDTQKYFSDLAGQMTVESRSKNYGNGLLPAHSYSEVGTPLIRPEEFSKLPHPLLFIQGMNPTFARKSFWDTDPAFRKHQDATDELPKPAKQSAAEYPLTKGQKITGHVLCTYLASIPGMMLLDIWARSAGTPLLQPGANPIIGTTLAWLIEPFRLIFRPSLKELVAALIVTIAFWAIGHFLIFRPFWRRWFSLRGVRAVKMKNSRKGVKNDPGSILKIETGHNIDKQE